MSINFTDFVNGFLDSIPATTDPKTKDEFFDYETEKNKFDIDYKKSFLKTRKWVGALTFLLVWVWLFAMIYFVLSNGAGELVWTDIYFSLSDAVLITLITTTTINVVAFLTIVIKNLFPIGQE